LKLQITIDGKKYEVEVDVAEEQNGRSYPSYVAPSYSAPSVNLPPPPPAAGAGAGAAPSGDVDESKVCRSPIAGIVVRINAQPGQQIQTNDPLLVLEAMKMETNITSPVTGKVKAINVKETDAVQTNQVLVEFE
jgi:biotin carboxyl carrier protein